MKLLTVPYPASPAAITAVIAGEAIVTADGVPGVLQHLKSGRLKALAVTSAQRVPGLDAPPVADTLPGYDVTGWFQVFVPTGTPAAIADRIHADVARISQQFDYVARLADLGIYPRSHTQADAREFFAAQQRLDEVALVADLGAGAVGSGPHGESAPHRGRGGLRHRGDRTRVEEGALAAASSSRGFR